MSETITSQDKKQALKLAYQIVTDKRNVNRYGGTALVRKDTPDMFTYSDMLRVLNGMYKELEAVPEKPMQKPLTLRELREFVTDKDATVWEERRNPDNFMKTCAGALAIMCMDARRDPDMSGAYTYNVAVRAWRTLPTEEERAAAPWEE